MSIYKKRRSLKKSPFTLYVFKFLSAILKKCCSYCKCNNIINIIISSLDITVKKITYKSLGMARVHCNKNKWFYEFYKCAHDVLRVWKGFLTYLGIKQVCVFFLLLFLLFLLLLLLLALFVSLEQVYQQLSVEVFGDDHAQEHLFHLRVEQQFYHYES